MKRPSRLYLALALSCAAAPAAVVPAAAQQSSAARPTPEGEHGWVGISVSIETNQEANGTISTSVTVTDVSRGSPAARAGIRAGDAIVSVNGRTFFPQDLRPGDSVLVAFRRDGRPREVALIADRRPVDIQSAPIWTLTVRADSMADRMYRAMDSLRIRLVRDGSGAQWRSVDVMELPDARMRVVERPGTSGGLPQAWTMTEVRPPFEFYLFRGEAHDSLRQVMAELNGHIRELRSREATRVRELAAALNEDATRIDRADPELRRLSQAMADAQNRALRLREAMERAALADARAERPTMLRAAPGANGSAPEGTFRPLDPYLLGQNRAAGAEVVELRPELADYFGVDGGVLIVDVPDRTPAAEAGLQPGDVLTDVGTRRVRSIAELRLGLGGSADEISVTVVRKGKRIQLLLRR